MRFSALLKKELRECLPWLLLASIALLALGSFFLSAPINYSNPNWYYRNLSPGIIVMSSSLTYISKLRLTGPLLLLSSIGLGLALGIRQFWIPNFTRTWQFLLHRSANRKTILTAKLTATSIAFVISLGPVWIGLYWYACRLEVIPIPQTPRIFIEGWIFITLGLVTYLGTALSGLSTTKWYTTKIFGLAFAAVIIMTFPLLTLGGLLVAITVSTAILLSQIFQTFLRREF
ncbi:MAG: hypothetical protein GY845_24560 [Planctomycetes bacterium]|nr:hypothetical protein [Planctomycetota bacterium]